jgi:hypothetical protein
MKKLEGAMPIPITKHQLLEQFRTERAQWDALLAEIGAECMEQPGVTGDWTIKDTVAHLTTWWRREVARLAAVKRGEQPPDHPPQSDVAIINQWIYLTNRDRPAADVLRDAQAVWQELGALLQSFSEELLLERERFAWLDGRPLGAGILEDFTKHLHEEHEPLIHAWLTRLADDRQQSVGASRR